MSKRFCGDCGSEVTGKKFCSNCGTKVEQAAASAASVTPATPAPAAPVSTSSAVSVKDTPGPQSSAATPAKSSQAAPVAAAKPSPVAFNNPVIPLDLVYNAEKAAKRGNKKTPTPCSFGPEGIQYVVDLMSPTAACKNCGWDKPAHSDIALVMRLQKKPEANAAPIKKKRDKEPCAARYSISESEQTCDVCGHLKGDH